MQSATTFRSPVSGEVRQPVEQAEAQVERLKAWLRSLGVAPDVILGLWI
ncbi:hypothetical protein J5X98_06375 [Leptothermofonsia sichuanensis E412]|nr:hypothetical protein [Leptothermofonsia sichuanensis]QZZ22032.1 hypothetical protein J5X98_06375 [Leptothermofonsia sichuanensis E412]